MDIRFITRNDYDQLLQLWKNNYFVNELDNYDQFKLFLEKNPRLSFLAKDQGHVIGSVLGSYDGRRGYIQKLVVHKEYRRKGVGQKLMNKVVRALRNAGAMYMPISCEEKLLPFYKSCGFKKTGQVSMSISYSTYRPPA